MALKGIELGKKFPLIFFCLLFFSVSVQGYADDSDTNVEPKIITLNGRETLVLPEKLLKSIKISFPGLRQPGPADMTGLWASKKQPGSFPFICWGDFDGDGLTDVALILFNESSWRFAIFHQYEDSFSPLYITGEIGTGGQIRPQEILLSRIDANVPWPPEEGELEFQFDAIEIWAERFGQTVIFWKDEFKSINPLGPLTSASKSADLSEPVVVNLNGRETLILPKKLQESIKRIFPDMRVPGPEDLTGLWASKKRPGSFPFICWGDFNGDGRKDVAMILINERIWRFVIFLQYENNFSPLYKRGEIMSGGQIQSPQEITLHKVKAGIWPPEEGEWEFQFDAIEIWAEKFGQTVIFWKDGEFKSINPLGPLTKLQIGAIF